jgi:hypothetical protein
MEQLREAEELAKKQKKLSKKKVKQGLIEVVLDEESQPKKVNSRLL